MITGEELLSAAVLSGAFLLLLVVAEAWRRLGTPKPEWTRKLIHVAGGIVCLLLPFVVSSPWIVLFMALGLTGLFTLAAHAGFLKSLHGVARSSRGAEYYPVAIFLVFLLAGDQKWLFVAAVMVLAVGDAFAALIGSRYGVIRYEVEGSDKSLEGSLVFLVVAFLAVHFPTLLMTDLPRPTSVLAAVLVATLVTGVEAISRRGTDNLFVPLAVVIILSKITRQPVAEIVFQNLSLLGIGLATVLLVRRFPFFNVGSTITFILYAYATWSLGSWQWALPVFVGLISYVATWLRVAPRERRADVGSRAVGRALLPPFGFLILANVTRDYDTYFGAYLAASAAVLAFALSGSLLHLESRERSRRDLAVIGTALLGCAVTLVPPWGVQSGAPLVVPLVITALVLPLTYLNVVVEGRDVEAAGTRPWSAWRFVLTVAAAGAVLLLQIAGIIPPWNPL
jgi:dolichol kinase